MFVVMRVVDIIFGRISLFRSLLMLVVVDVAAAAAALAAAAGALAVIVSTDHPGLIR